MCVSIFVDDHSHCIKTWKSGILLPQALIFLGLQVVISLIQHSRINIAGLCWGPPFGRIEKKKKKKTKEKNISIVIKGTLA